MARIDRRLRALGVDLDNFEDRLDGAGSCCDGWIGEHVEGLCGHETEVYEYAYRIATAVLNFPERDRRLRLIQRVRPNWLRIWLLRVAREI